jgi:hypothetical protein
MITGEAARVLGPVGLAGCWAEDGIVWKKELQRKKKIRAWTEIF